MRSTMSEVESETGLTVSSVLAVVFKSPVWSGFLPIFSKTETETGL